jgi:hypothetical protein
LQILTPHKLIPKHKIKKPQGNTSEEKKGSLADPDLKLIPKPARSKPREHAK